MGEVVDIVPVLPLGHTAIVEPTRIAGSHAMGVTDEERPDVLLDTEVDDFAGGLVAQVTHTTIGLAADLVLRSLQLLPTTRMLLTAALLFGKLAELSAPLPFERPDTAPSHDEGLARTGRQGSKVDFSQVNRRLHGSGCFFRLPDFDAHVQFKAAIPDECAGACVFWKLERQNQGRAAFAHRQNDAPALCAHRLRGPVHRVEAFLAPGVLHEHLGMFLAEFARAFNGAEQSAEDRLHRLAVQGEASFGQLVQIVLVGPVGVVHSGLAVDLDADIPDPGRFHLSRCEAVEEGWRELIKPIYPRCFHKYPFFFLARKTVTDPHAGPYEERGRVHAVHWKMGVIPPSFDKLFGRKDARYGEKEDPYRPYFWRTFRRT